MLLAAVMSWPFAAVLIALFAMIAAMVWAGAYSDRVTIYKCDKCGNCSKEHED